MAATSLTLDERSPTSRHLVKPSMMRSRCRWAIPSSIRFTRSRAPALRGSAPLRRVAMALAIASSMSAELGEPSSETDMVFQFPKCWRDNHAMGNSR